MNKPIITWGVFDGVHRGHKRLIHSIVKWAKSTNGIPVVLTFYEHPDKILKDKQPPLITPLEYRFSLLKEEGIKEIVAFPFSNEFKNLTPEQFIRDIIVNWLQAYGIVINASMHFGKGQKGNLSTLKQLCKKYHLKLKTINPLLYKGKPISSTRIRKSLINGNLNETKIMLGRPIKLIGTVVHGDERGRKLGFPTANLNLHHQLIPPQGVYAAKAGIDAHPFNALANIGTRPTFTDDTNPTIEVHILNLKNSHYNNLYGKNIEVELIAKIRNEKKFKNATALINQIKKDKEWFK